MNLDFTTVKNNRAPLPEGTYEVKIAKAAEKMSKKGNPMLAVEFDVQTEGFENHKLWAYLVMTEDAMWKMQEFCLGLGMDADGIVDIEPEDMIGMDMTVKVTQDTLDDGTITNRVVKFLRG